MSEQSDIRSMDALEAELIASIGRIRTHGSRRHPSPHKPLLVIWALARLESGSASYRFLYREAHQPVSELLVAAGRQPRPWYPFVRMGAEPFWDLRGSFDLNSAGDVNSPATLIDAGASGGFAQRYQQLLHDVTRVRRLAFRTAHHWLEPTLSDELLDLARSMTARSPHVSAL